LGMLRATFISAGGLFGSSGLPRSAPSKIISRAVDLTPARSSKIDNGTPVHSALPTPPRLHCTPFTFGSRKLRLLPAHSSVAGIFRDSNLISSSKLISNDFQTAHTIHSRDLDLSNI